MRNINIEEDQDTMVASFSSKIPVVDLLVSGHAPQPES